MQPSQEAQANTDIETQRVKLSTAYNNAIQQAISENDYQKAQALYNEGVRVDNSLVEQSQQQAALDYQYQQQVAAQKQQQFENDMATNNAQMQAAFARADYGDPSALKSLYGWDDATTQQQLYAWKIKNGLITNFNSGSGGGRSSGRSSSSSDNNPTGDNGGGGAATTQTSYYTSLSSQLENILDKGYTTVTTNRMANLISQYLSKGQITQAQAQALSDKYIG